MTGWNLPPGCTQRHIDEAFGGPDPSPLQEEVWSLLEKAGMPEPLLQAVDDIIAEWEAGRNEPDPDYALEDWKESRR